MSGFGDKEDPMLRLYRGYSGTPAHPDSPAGGGGPGYFREPGPLGMSGSSSSGLLHPDSPAGRRLTPSDIEKAFEKKISRKKNAFEKHSLKRSAESCDAILPSNSDAILLVQLTFAEATRGKGITAANSALEMAAIVFTVINRSNYLKNKNHKISPSFFGATSASISGVITPQQFGSVGGSNFTLANTPKNIDTSNRLGQMNCDFLKLVILTVNGALEGTIVDPFVAKGGVYGFRTLGHGGSGGSFITFPPSLQINGAGNTFFGLNSR